LPELNSPRSRTFVDEVKKGLTNTAFQAQETSPGERIAAIYQDTIDFEHSSVAGLAEHCVYDTGIRPRDSRFVKALFHLATKRTSVITPKKHKNIRRQNVIRLNQSVDEPTNSFCLTDFSWEGKKGDLTRR
jgi:hypothetical protein